MPRPKPKAVPRNGNAFSVLAATRRALAKDGHLSTEKIDRIMVAARAGDYDHLLQTCMKHVDLDVS